MGMNRTQLANRLRSLVFDNSLSKTDLRALINEAITETDLKRAFSTCS